MRINFRQGLISFQKDNGNPDFLHPSSTAYYVSHVVSPTPTIAAVAHGQSDYLLHFDRNVENAWGPINPDAPQTFLFWDIDLLTAEVTYGMTTLAPIVSLLEPTKVDGQHWFDLNDTTMKVWSTTRNKWQPKARVFAGKVMNGNVQSLVHNIQGTQVQLDVPGNPGYVLRDHLLNPLRKSNGEFLTDDAYAYVNTTVGTSGVLVQPVNRIVPVRAGENLPAMSLVYFSGDDTVRLASSDPALVPMRIPVGIVTEAVAQGDVGNLSPFGEISYDQWDWTGHAGEPLYTDSYGQITLKRPEGLLAFRVGFVKNKNTVLLGIDAETYPQVYQADINSLIISGVSPVSTESAVNNIGERVVTISVPNATDLSSGLMTGAQVTALATLGTRITVAEADIDSLEVNKANVNHTHTIPQVSGLQGALDGKSDVGHLHDDRYSLLGHAHPEYALAQHVHTIVDVDGLQTELNQKANRAHLNAISEIYSTVDRSGTYDVGSGPTLQEELDGKSDVGHQHAIADTTGLQAALDGKSPLEHIHVIAEVSGLQDELDNRAYVSHTHQISNVTGLQAALDDKANVEHAHVVAEITDFKQGVADSIVAGVNIGTFQDEAGNTVISAIIPDAAPTLMAVETAQDVQLQNVLNVSGLDFSNNLSIRQVVDQEDGTKHLRLSHVTRTIRTIIPGA